MPSHPFRIREIVGQAGLSEATVDRVLNGRGGVGLPGVGLRGVGLRGVTVTPSAVGVVTPFNIP